MRGNKHPRDKEVDFEGDVAEAAFLVDLVMFKFDFSNRPTKLSWKLGKSVKVSEKRLVHRMLGEITPFSFNHTSVAVRRKQQQQKDLRICIFKGLCKNKRYLKTFLKKKQNKEKTLKQMLGWD